MESCVCGQIKGHLPPCTPRKPEKECTCGASYYRGCFCNLTLGEFMMSPFAKGI